MQALLPSHTLPVKGLSDGVKPQLLARPHARGLSLQRVKGDPPMPMPGPLQVMLALLARLRALLSSHALPINGPSECTKHQPLACPHARGFSVNSSPLGPCLGPLQVMFAEPMNLRAMGQKPSPPEAARMHLATSQESEEVAQQHTSSMSGVCSALVAIIMFCRKPQHQFSLMFAHSQTAAKCTVAAAATAGAAPVQSLCQVIGAGCH